MRDVILHPHALSELREANLHYAEISFRLADAFADRVNQSIEAIRRNPIGFPVLEGGVRKYVMLRFPFSILYEDLDKILYIWAIAHQSRHPDYWKSRVKDNAE